MHNPNVVLMGALKSSIKESTCKKGAIPAGKFVHWKTSDDSLSVAAADGKLKGVSLGKDLSNTNFTAYVERGKGVPVLLTAGFTPVLGANVYYDNTTGLAVTSSSSANVIAVAATYSQVPSGGGIAEDGSAVEAAVIDFIGGL